MFGIVKSYDGKWEFDPDNLGMSLLGLGGIGAGAAFIAALSIGGFQLYAYTFTGPCAFKGGVSQTAQDYLYCGNGIRVSTKPDDTRTATYELRVK